MPNSPSLDERIQEQFSIAQKQYAAYDQTLNALAAVSFVLSRVTDVAEQTSLVDFRPKLEPVDAGADPYTPDGHIMQRPSFDFILELKTSWNDKDVSQVVKYGRSQRYYRQDSSKETFPKDRCILLGYQNPPGEVNLDNLFDAWRSNGFAFPLVIFRYSLESAADGDRMFFMRIPYSRNGICPISTFGRVINSVRGCSVKVDNYKQYRPKFHRAGDPVIPSYAAVLWWTTYARYYLTEEQKVEMAERGRLTTPLVISVDLDTVPVPSGVEVPLTRNDVRHALEFLRQANLATLKKRARSYEIGLKEDRFIRLPQGGPVATNASDASLSTKILARWATLKVKKPIEPPERKSKSRKLAKVRASRLRGRRDTRTGDLFPR